MPVQQREENERGEEEVGPRWADRFNLRVVLPAIRAFGFDQPKAFCFLPELLIDFKLQLEYIGASYSVLKCSD